jgi:hypothetical protein
MTTVSNLLLFIGLTMLAIAAGLNTYSGYAPADPNSTPLFSPLWWTRWFPLYASGAALLLVGWCCGFRGGTIKPNFIVDIAEQVMRETYYQKEHFVTHLHSNRITYNN